MFSTNKKYILFVFLFLMLAQFHKLMAQPNSYIRLDSKDKPSKYQTKILPVEKSNDQEIESGKGELRGFKKFMQGTYTHFNFLFNANNKIKDALQMAQSRLDEDYTQLLPYDNYDLKMMSKNTFLDSAIEKANGSLLLHDIRNQWNDEVYLILGKSFYYKMMWDSAAIHFQYLNYAFAPKDDGYDIPIGSNISNKEQELSIISTKPKGIFKHNPRRNEGLLWLARALIMSGDVTTGKGILDLLILDPHLPKDLRPKLFDAMARAFYYSNQYDSSAYYMDASFSVAENNLDKSRRKYLAAQLWQLSGHLEEATIDFGYAASHSPNILMEIYALLQLANINSEHNNKTNQLDKLASLSKKGKYKDYQDLVFYLMGKQYLSQSDTTNAVKYFTASTKTLSQNGQLWKNRSFQQLGDIGEKRMQFNILVNNYDSINNMFGYGEERNNLQRRKEATNKLGKILKQIYAQDSLLQLASLPASEQEKILKSHLRHIRKLLGLKDQDNTPNNMLFNNSNTTTDLFSGVSNKSGQWYFNNNDVKAQGSQSFIAKFGQRPNVDNWIRQSAIQAISALQNNNLSQGDPTIPKIDSSQITLQYLKDQLPNTPEKKQEALRLMSDNYLQAGKVMEDNMYNFPAAIWFYQQAESLDSSYSKNKEELLYRFSTSYFENGDKKAGNTLRQQLQKQFPNSQYLQQSIKSSNKKDTIRSENSIAGKTYAHIYNELLAGEFAKANTDKLKADSLYGSQYWTPQLLYIESIYYVSERKDSIAIFKLKTLEKMFPTSPIKIQAITMIDVLSRRKEIEKYLTNLQITRLEDTDEVFVRRGIDEHFDASLKEKGPIKLKDTTTSVIKQNTSLIIPKISAAKSDTSSKNGIPPYIIALDSPHYVMVLLDKVAKVFATETGNAFNRFNKQNYRNQNLGFRSQILDDRYQVVLIGPFKDAGDAYIYVDKVAPVTPNRILPWLTKDKYSFSLISDRNLAILLQYKNLEDYKSKLHETLPGKF